LWLIHSALAQTVRKHGSGALPEHKPEMVVRSHLFQAGNRFFLHRRDLPGSPDCCFVLLRYQAVVFVNGCFWHGHSCPHPYHVREEAGTHRYNVGTDTLKLCATSFGVVPLANSFLAA
jgi:DNA mismatch endonuclease Vsr